MSSPIKYIPTGCFRAERSLAQNVSSSASRDTLLTFQYYERQHVYCHPSLQSEADWKIRMEGELFETGKALNITPYDKLQEFVTQELKKNFNQENTYEQSDDALSD